MIRLDNITKSYKNGGVNTYVLRHVKLEINDGDFVIVMRPSGEGKSTLLNIIGMLDVATEGKYFFLDKPFTN